MDQHAARIANLLVGNKESEAVIELTYGGAKLKSEQTMLIAVCGADMSATVDGEKLPLQRPVVIKAGSVLHFRQNRAGCRVYIAIGGGIAVQPVLQSRSTYLRGGFGGLQGRALQSGDRIELQSAGEHTSSFYIKEKLLKGMNASSSFGATSWYTDYNDRKTILSPANIRIIAGKHYGMLSEASRIKLTHNVFKIGIQSDRMGYRLDGAQLQLEQSLTLLSEGVATGTVQLPPSGQPIILLADRQTTGGYPRIAHVCAADLPKLAQMKPGDLLVFQVIAHHEAERLLIKSELDFQQMKTAIALKHQSML